MKTKFTPGEWAVSEENSKNANWIKYDVGIYYGIVCEVKGTISSMVDWIAPASQAKANAHLIAAAPDLYEALQSMVDWLNSEDDIGDQEEKALKALAKARGEA